MGHRGSASTSNDNENLCKVLLNEVPDSIETTMRKETCIYNVPANISQSKRDAYTPKVICIGPIHHKNENELKRRYVNQFFNRLRGENWEPFQEDLANTVKKCAAEISLYYEDESLELFKDPKELSKMIVWDAAFILELFLKTGEYKKYQNSRKTSQDDDRYKYDYIIGKPWLTATIQRDLILLENQLPFCILDELYKIAAKYIKPDCICFLELSCNYFENYNKKKTSPPKILHFTDLVRFFLSSKHLTISKDTDPHCDTAAGLEEAGMEFKSSEHECLLTIFKDEIPYCVRAARLAEAGMKFIPSKHECLLDINACSVDSGTNYIKKGELHVPPLVIDDNTECLLRNLMALEQCHFPEEENICQYVRFLDLLVDTDEDADLLITSKVIINKLGKSADVVELINELCKGIVEVPSYYSHLAKELYEYSDCWCNKSKAFLRRQYFRNVWIGTGTVVGLFLLFITLQSFVRSFL